ncbi:MAG: MDR/zinc-dependent alcohol dehydrogenase-like family protein [Petrotogales bacterium]
MKALFFDGEMQLKEVEKPSLKDYKNNTYTLIKVKKAAICDTDLEIIKGYMGFKGIPGHEFVGIVEKSNQEHLLGKRVVGEINIGCGKCDMCKKGLKKHCRNIKVLGIDNWNGAFAEYLILPAENVHILPDNITDNEAVFVEPLAAAFQILKCSEFSSDKLIGVLGDGKLGLLISQILESKQISHILFGKHPDRIAPLSTKHINFKNHKHESSSEFRKKFDIIVEATGNQKGLEAGLFLTKPTGTIILKSTYAGNDGVNLSPAVVNEIRLVGSRCGNFNEALEALKNKSINVFPLIDSEFSLNNYKEAFEHARNSMKTIFKIGKE